MRLIYLTFLFFSLTQSGIGQLSLGVYFSGLGYHPHPNENTSFYKNKISKDGRLAAFTSVGFQVVYRVNDYFGIELAQVYMFADCAGKPAGISHFGIELYDDIIGIRNPVHEVSIDFGPMWYYRKGWKTISAYTQEPSFITDSALRPAWESKFVWYGGKVNYTWKPDEDKPAFQFHLLPAHPYLYTFAVGAQF